MVMKGLRETLQFLGDNAGATIDEDVMGRWGEWVAKHHPTWTNLISLSLDQKRKKTMRQIALFVLICPNPGLCPFAWDTKDEEAWNQSKPTPNEWLAALDPKMGRFAAKLVDFFLSMNPIYGLAQLNLSACILYPMLPQRIGDKLLDKMILVRPKEKIANRLPGVAQILQSKNVIEEIRDQVDKICVHHSFKEHKSLGHGEKSGLLAGYAFMVVQLIPAQAVSDELFARQINFLIDHEDQFRDRSLPYAIFNLNFLRLRLPEIQTRFLNQKLVDTLRRVYQFVDRVDSTSKILEALEPPPSEKNPTGR